MLALVWPALGRAEPLQSDRPGRSDPASVLPKGTGQIELGGSFDRETTGENVTTWSAPEPLLRLGVLERAELRLSAEGWIGSREDGETEHAGSDLELGTKIRLLEQRQWLPATSLEVGLRFPTGGRTVTSDGYDPFGTVLASWELPQHLTLDANLGVAAPTQGVDDSGRIYELFVAASLGIALSDRVGAFLEPYATVRGEGKPDEQALDGGFTYLLTDDVELDVSAGVGLDHTALDFFVGAGIAWRFRSVEEHGPARPAPDAARSDRVAPR